MKHVIFSEFVRAIAECFQLYISCLLERHSVENIPTTPRSAWSGMLQILHHEQYPGKSYIMILPTIGLDPSYSSCINTRMQFVSYQAKQYGATHILPNLVLERPNKYPVANSWLRSERYGSQTQMVSHVNELPWKHLTFNGRLRNARTH